MGHPNKFNSTFFLGALFVALMATTAPLGAYGQLLPIIIQGRVQGTVVCSATGNPVSGVPNAGLANVTVLLQCLGITGNVSVAETLLDGSFTLTISNVLNLNAVLANTTSCKVLVPVVNFPNLNCTIFPPNVALVAGVVPNGFNVTPFGIIAQFITNVFNILLT